MSPFICLSRGGGCVLAIIGTFVVLASVIGGYLATGSSMLLLWHPLEVVIIIGAAMGDESFGARVHVCISILIK